MRKRNLKGEIKRHLSALILLSCILISEIFYPNHICYVLVITMLLLCFYILVKANHNYKKQLQQKHGADKKSQKINQNIQLFQGLVTERKNLVYEWRKRAIDGVFGYVYIKDVLWIADIYLVVLAYESEKLKEEILLGNLFSQQEFIEFLDQKLIQLCLSYMKKVEISFKINKIENLPLFNANKEREITLGKMLKFIKFNIWINN